MYTHTILHKNNIYLNFYKIKKLGLCLAYKKFIIQFKYNQPFVLLKYQAATSFSFYIYKQ